MDNFPEPKEFKLGTTVKIVDIIDITNPNSVTITIEDPNGVKSIEDQNMTKIADYIYQYLYQSTHYSDGGLEGTYIAEIKVVCGSYECIRSIEFQLRRTFRNK